jgi:hypothetical protein
MLHTQVTKGLRRANKATPTIRQITDTFNFSHTKVSADASNTKALGACVTEHQVAFFSLPAPATEYLIPIFNDEVSFVIVFIAFLANWDLEDRV